MRLSVLATAISVSIVGLSVAADVEAAIKRQTDIPAQGLAGALQRLTKERDIQLVYRAELVRDLNTGGASGELTSVEALAQLLSGTNLTYRYLDDRTITIAPLAKENSPAATNQMGGGEAVSRTRAPTDSSREGGGQKSFWDRFRLAQVDQATPSNERSTGQVGADSKGRFVASLEEIIVTAQKRSERLQDVPVPVTAISAEALTDRNQLLIRDYFTSVPGLNVVPSVQSQQTLSIRGITTGTGNPTVAIMLDDMPYTASTNFGGGRTVPDIDPGDLARIEVLRGPQGTLYGASSLGGLLKFVTRDPSTDRASGRVQVGTSSVNNGDGLGYNVRGSANVPLSDTVAVRASAFTRRDAGYIDNVQIAESGINQANADGGRLSLLWRPSDDFSLKLGALFQKVSGDGATSVDPTLGDLQQSRLRDTGWYDRKAQAYSAALTADLGRADLTSISGYSINSYQDALDLGYALGASAQAAFGVSGVPDVSSSKSKKFTQEIRFSAPFGRRTEWLFGAFYTNEDSRGKDTRFAANTTTGVIVGTLGDLDYPTTYQEYAGFADLTYRLTDRFDVQFGVRQSEIKQTYDQTSVNAQGVATITPQLDINSDAFTYLLTPRFKISDDLMLYARLASGYRAGGPNIVQGSGVPRQYAPDKTQNYEIGVKGGFLDRKLSVDASIYYIDWKDIQFNLLSPASITYTGNGSSAKSQGIELAVESKPLAGLAISGWVAWSDAELNEDFAPNNPAFGLSGDRLPNSSRFSGHVSADWEFLLTSDFTGFVGGSASYVGDRTGPFRPRAAPQRQLLPAYTQTDLRVGVKKDTWTANLFVTNLDDERGVLYGGLGANPPTAFAYIQPRTVGLTLTKTF